MSDLAVDALPTIRLGNRVKDKITSFTGIAVARSEHLYGCTHIHIKPETLDDKGKPQDSFVVDIARCEFIDDAFGRDSQPISPGLGKHVRDRIGGGFEGIVVITTDFLFATPECCVETRDLIEGKPHTEWFTARRLEEVIEREAIPETSRGPGSSTAALPRT